MDRELLFYERKRLHSVRGGTIFGDDVVFLNNGELSVSGNGAVYNGGAFDAGSLLIAHCGSVVFERNYLNINGVHILRSLYQSDSSRGIVLATAHGEGKDDAGIVFYDSIYAEGDLTMNQWVNSSGERETNYGSILFSGKNTLFGLEAVEGGQASDSEIKASRSSIVLGNVSFLGGQLIVEEGMGI